MTVWSWARTDRLQRNVLLTLRVRPSRGHNLTRSVRSTIITDLPFLTVLLAVLMVLVVGFSGCGRSKKQVWPVSGKVTFQGKPVAAGTIRFRKLGVDMTSNLRTDGSYEVVMAEGRGLPEGDYEVAVIPPGAIPGTPVPMGPMSSPPPKLVCRDIPEKYRDPSTSRVTLTVKPGNNVCDVDMQP